MGKSPASIRFSRLGPEHGPDLCEFYNNLSRASLRTFRPLGTKTTIRVCRAIARDNQPDRDIKFDRVAWCSGIIVGWGFLWHLDSAEPDLGLGVADDFQGRGIGTRLVREVMAEAKRREVERVCLIVVKENEWAQKIYQRVGFQVRGEFVDDSDGLTYYRMSAEVGKVDAGE
ncbi:MAG: GNAT family N-acetyltransferase [Opitutaceae bacterium]